MENIYHDYWDQELMYQFLTEDKCKKKAYVCSPFSADDKEGMLQNMRTARAYMFYAMKKMNMSARAPHAYLPKLLDDTYREERALALSFDMKLLEICEIVIVCGTRISRGMQMEIEQAFRLNKEVYHWPDTDQAQLLPLKKWRQVYEMQIQK